MSDRPERPTLAVDMPPPDFVATDVLRGVSVDDLATLAQSTPTAPGTATLGEPERQQGASIRYNRPQIGVLLRTFVQDARMGAEVKQSGAGRAFIPAGLSLPVQSDTPMPDGRRIARPMPSVNRDDLQVIQPPEAAR